MAWLIRLLPGRQDHQQERLRKPTATVNGQARGAMPQGLPVTEPSSSRVTATPGQSAGAAIGFTPERSSRRTRIMTSVMTSATSMIPAETMYPWENPCARA
jgi:hypothetical protein